MSQADLFRGGTFTTVVNVKSGQPFDVYCGRAAPGKFPASIWRNTHHMETEADRQRVITAFEADLVKHPVLLCRLVELRGKRLGCWCHPKPCHCDVLARWADAPSKELLVAHWRARRGPETKAPLEWLDFMQRWGLLSRTVTTWKAMPEEAAARCLEGIAKAHAGFPRLDSGRGAA